MMKRRSEASQGFSLAFIDVMACGLGAVVLLLVILEFREQIALSADFAENQKSQKVKSQNPSDEELRQQLSELKLRSSQLEENIATLSVQAASQRIANAALEQNIKDATMRPAAFSSDVIQQEGENLIGLKVQGRRILIGLDMSSSMVSPKISDAILYNAGGFKIGQSEKWEQAKFATDWVVKNGPVSSKYIVVAFNEEATPLTQDFQSQQQALDSLGIQFSSLKPSGGSDLAAILQAVDRYKPDEVFLITDGLPTKTRKSVSSMAAIVKACGVRSRPFVSGGCREAMFLSAVSRSSELPRTRLNTILLPLEGDPRAAPLFWGLTSRLGGVTLTPDPLWR